MTLQAPLRCAVLGALLAASPWASAAEPVRSDLADCALGSGGADATGNDCGTVARTEDYSRFHPAPRPAARSPLPLARVSAKPAAPPAAPRPAANWPEGQTSCAAATGGADPTGNECNGQSATAPILTAKLRR